MAKKIIFVTGTRADFGKIKSTIKKLQKNKNYKITIIVTGMHLMQKYGSTYLEIKKSFPRTDIRRFKNQKNYQSQDIILSNTINKISPILKKISPDMIIVHGDRVESLATAIAGSFNNFLIAHIEGGEVSGTIDEHIRHSISKLAHLHFVSNQEAKRRLLQLGELPQTIFVTGSPEIDIMKSDNLPSIELAKKRYNVNFNKYSLIIYHPVTTEKKNKISFEVDCLIRFIKLIKTNFILIYPNNDPGNEIIIRKYLNSFKKNKKVKIFKSLRFEYYLTFLLNSNFIIGNSSSGVREAPFYGIPTINLGLRQKNRNNAKSIFDSKFSLKEMSKIFKSNKNLKFKKSKMFGDGKSSDKINKILKNKNIWNISRQKYLQIIKNR